MPEIGVYVLGSVVNFLLECNPKLIVGVVSVQGETEGTRCTAIVSRSIFISSRSCSIQRPKVGIADTLF